MKRTPLKRRKPLRPYIPPGLEPAQRQALLEAARCAQKPRKVMKRVSVKQKGRLAIYWVMIESAKQDVAPCEKCRDFFPWEALEPHHPFGRGRDNLFRVVMVCAECHAWIHRHANDAHALGWLQAPIRGLPEDPNSPRPWKNLITA